MTARNSWIRRAATAVSALVLLTLGSATHGVYSAPAHSTTIRIAFSTWTGYGPLVVAAQKGFFSKQGLDVKYSIVEDPNARRAAVQGGQLDGVASTIDTFTRWYATGVPVQVVFGIDHSAGGDGIVAKKSITSMAQLKGKTVAVNVGSVSEFFFDYVLQQHHMSLKDVQLKDMPDSSVAGSTFVAGRVDAAVTWEPWLSRAASRSFGHILVSSKTYPNIIVDCFAFRSSFVNQNPAAVRKFVRAYYQAVRYTKTHHSDAYGIIGKYVNEKPAAVADDLSKVPLMTAGTSKAYFGTASRHGAIYRVASFAARFWLRLNRISKIPDFRFINPSYL